MIRYPWNLIIRAILENGGIDVNIRGLEGLDVKEIFDLPSVAILRDIRLQLYNPDLSDSEKIAWIQAVLG